MKLSKKLIVATMVVISICFFQGCGHLDRADIVDNASVERTSKKSSETDMMSQAIEAGKDINTPILSEANERQAALIDAEIGRVPILDNGIKLIDIAELLNLSKDDLLEKYKGCLELVRQDLNYEEYYNYDMDVYIVCYSDRFNEGYFVKYIELQRDKISFNGVTQNMNFEQVMDVLGETEILTVEDGLPGLCSYEIRYQYNDINLRIYSWEKDGRDGILISIVDDFLPEYRSISITPEQINHYFKISKEKLEDEIGNGEVSQFNEEWIKYPQFGVNFRYSQDGLQLIAMTLDQKYQINDLKQGIALEEVTSVMGGGNIKEHHSEEDGLVKVIEYTYSNFLLKVSKYTIDGIQTNWDILWKDHLN